MQVSYTVTVSVDSISVNTLEQAALEGAREAGKKLFQALLGLAEKTLPKQRICECGGRLESRGRVQRELMTVVGDIVFDRQKLRCLSCGKERYPLDEGLGIAERRLVAPGLREMALWLATEMAYEKSTEGLQKLCGIAISEGTIKKILYRKKAARFLGKRNRSVRECGSKEGMWLQAMAKRGYLSRWTAQG